MTLRLSGGRRLRSPPGSIARPTTARVRLAVINILRTRLNGCRWLDLCCGSGVMACEALRRGARQVVAVERDRRIAAVALANLQAVAAEQAAGQREASATVSVVHDEAVRWLRKSRSRAGCRHQPFDLIYLDPPYTAGLHNPLTAAIAAGGWLVPGGLLIRECAREAVPEPPDGWLLRDRRSYGRTVVQLLVENRPEQSHPSGASTLQGTAAAVLIPGSHEQTHQGDGNQAEHDAAEKRFDHGAQG